MLKRTKGRLLITLLVITGLAGTIRDTSINNKERKLAVTRLKDTRSNLLNSIKGLSEAQLNWKAAEDKWSIKECFYHIILTENGLWEMLENKMKEPSTPEKRAGVKLTDDGIYTTITNRTSKFKAAEPFLPVKANWQSMHEAIAAFKTMRASHLKYTRSTTEDLRNHIISLPFGDVDAYQFILFTIGHSDRHTQQINEVKANPGFPKN